MVRLPQYITAFIVHDMHNKRGSILHTQNRPAKITLYLSYDKYKVNSDAII